MIQQIEELLKQHQAWLRDRTTLKEVGGWIEITTPYLDRHNDHLQIYARNENGSWILSDDGYTISDLEMSGCILKSPKRTSILESTLNGFGVKLGNHDDLVVHASDATFPFKKHNLVQAMLAVGDLFYLAEPTVASVFHEDVEKWMKQRGIRYSQDLKITGKSGFDFKIDFIIPSSAHKRERLVRLITNPNRDSALNIIACYVDIKGTRPDSLAYAFVNDKLREVPSGVVEALNNYDIRPILWSKRSEAERELAA